MVSVGCLCFGTQSPAENLSYSGCYTARKLGYLASLWTAQNLLLPCGILFASLSPHSHPRLCLHLLSVNIFKFSYFWIETNFPLKNSSICVSCSLFPGSCDVPPSLFATHSLHLSWLSHALLLNTDSFHMLSCSELSWSGWKGRLFIYPNKGFTVYTLTLNASWYFQLILRSSS